MADLVATFRELPTAKASFATKFVNRQLLDLRTNRVTKHVGIDPRDLERAKVKLKPVSLAEQPEALIVRRFDEVVEAQQVFDQALAKVGQRSGLGAAATKEALNAEIRRIIKEDVGGAGEKVRRALEISGFEYQEGVGFVMMKRPAP